MIYQNIYINRFNELSNYYNNDKLLLERLSENVILETLDLKTVLRNIKKFFSDAWTKIKSAFDRFMKFITTKLSKIFPFINSNEDNMKKGYEIVEQAIKNPNDSFTVNKKEDGEITYLDKPEIVPGSSVKFNIDRNPKYIKSSSSDSKISQKTDESKNKNSLDIMNNYIKTIDNAYEKNKNDKKGFVNDISGFIQGAYMLTSDQYLKLVEYTYNNYSDMFDKPNLNEINLMKTNKSEWTTDFLNECLTYTRHNLSYQFLKFIHKVSYYIYNDYNANDRIIENSDILEKIKSIISDFKIINIDDVQAKFYRFVSNNLDDYISLSKSEYTRLDIGKIEDHIEEEKTNILNDIGISRGNKTIEDLKHDIEKTIGTKSEFDIVNKIEVMYSPTIIKNELNSLKKDLSGNKNIMNRFNSICHNFMNQLSVLENDSNPSIMNLYKYYNAIIPFIMNCINTSYNLLVKYTNLKIDQLNKVANFYISLGKLKQSDLKEQTSIFESVQFI